VKFDGQAEVADCLPMSIFALHDKNFVSKLLVINLHEFYFSITSLIEHFMSFSIKLSFTPFSPAQSSPVRF